MQNHIGCICLTFPHCAFSNGSSNWSLERMHSRIGCICLIFHHSVSSNVSPMHSVRSMHSHSGCIFSTTCLFYWNLFYLNLVVHHFDSFPACKYYDISCKFRFQLREVGWDRILCAYWCWEVTLALDWKDRNWKWKPSIFSQSPKMTFDLKKCHQKTNTDICTWYLASWDAIEPTWVTESLSQSVSESL